MTTHFPHLFSPLKIGGLEVKNRIVMMPMSVYSRRLTRPDGSYSKDRADYYIARAGVPATLRFPVDQVVVSIGYISDNELYKQLPPEYTHLIGDAKAPANVMGAVWQAYEIARNI